MPTCSKRLFLTWATGFFGMMALLTLLIAISTSSWLNAKEKVQEESSTANQSYKLTVIGLWKQCVYLDEEIELQEGNCSYINYFKNQDKDGLGPTEAILLSLRKATLFPILSVIILFVGAVIYISSHSNQEKKVLTFVSGIIYVIGGLLILIGIILYIGAITEEAGNSSKPSMDSPKFEYWYGYSFVLTITSFSCAEFTGVLAVYLYISRHKHSYRKKAERLQQLQSSSSSQKIHSRSALSLTNSTKATSKTQLPTFNYYHNDNDLTQSPATSHVRHNNSRANGCVGGFGREAFSQRHTLPVNASLANLPSYDYSDPRRPEAAYHANDTGSWSTYAPAGQLIKAASTASMLNQQYSQYRQEWLEPANSQFNEYYDDEDDESAYKETTPHRFGRQSSASVKIAREPSRHTLVSGVNNPHADWLASTHAPGRGLCTPDSNVYRRTTPV